MRLDGPVGQLDGARAPGQEVQERSADEAGRRVREISQGQKILRSPIQLARLEGLVGEPEPILHGSLKATQANSCQGAPGEGSPPARKRVEQPAQIGLGLGVSAQIELCLGARGQR